MIRDNIKPKLQVLNYDRKMVLVRAIEVDEVDNKSYLRTLMLLVENEFITTNYPDTKLLLSELKLFNQGNKQNKYTSLEQKDGDINLKLKLSDSVIYISKVEAHAITEIYHESKVGTSMKKLFDGEYRPELSVLTSWIHEAGLLFKNRGI